ncbi:hypothetical protein FQR65_LT18924 [Abscondita terminalis]|nr:hypothetical protein FQR65_LT18924 [Abscondita terminalis]
MDFGNILGLGVAAEIVDIVERNSTNVFELPEAVFVKYFRLSREMTLYVINIIQPYLPQQRRVTVVPLERKYSL